MSAGNSNPVRKHLVCVLVLVLATPAFLAASAEGAGAAAYAGGPYDARVGEPVTLTGSASGGTPPYAFAWDLDGDGVFETPGATASVTFAAEGAWTPTFRVEDATAATTTAVADVLVSFPTPMQATALRSWDFDGEADPASGLTCDSTDGQHGGWSWFRPVFPEPNQATDWRTVTSAPDSGDCAWYHGADAGTYGAGQIADLLSPSPSSSEPCIDVPATYAAARLDLAVFGELEPGADWLRIEFAPGECVDDGSAAFTLQARLTGAQGDLAVGTYAKHGVDATALVGAGPSQVRFRVVSDANNLGCQESDPLTHVCPGYRLDTLRLIGLTAQPGTAPGSFVASATASAGSVALSWTASQGASDYTIHRAASPGFAPLASNQVGATSGAAFTDTSPPSGLLHYVVVARGKEGTTLSNGVTASATSDATAPTPPSLSGTDLVAGGAVRLDWTAAADAESGIASYAVLRDGVEITVLGGTTLTYADTGLADGRAYTYLVRARNGVGLAADSNSVTVTPTSDTTPPARVAGLVALAASRTVTLDWADNAEPDLAGYVVRRDGQPIREVSASAHVDLDVVNGVTYCYTVAARDAAGNEGAPSTEACARPAAPPPVPVVAWPMVRRDPAATGATPEAAFYVTSPATLGTLRAAAATAPLVGDLDGDGQNEVVVAVGTDSVAPMQVVAYRVDEDLTQALVESWRADLPRRLPAHGDGFVATPALVEAGDGDDGLEVAVAYTYLAGTAGEGAIDTLVALLDGDGRVLAAVEAPYPAEGSDVVVANVDDDAAMEVVFTNAASSTSDGASLPSSVAVFEAFEGALRAQATIPVANLETSAPVALADLDGDGNPEVLAPYWTSTPTRTTGGVVIGDLDGDASLNVALPVGVMGVTAGDLDRDADLEIVATGRNGASLQVLDTAGAAYAPVASASAGMLWNTAALGDVDGDGAVEIVVAEHNDFVDDIARSGTIRVYGYSAGALTLEATIVRQAMGEDLRVPSGPVLVDVDGDGGLDVVVASLNGRVDAYDGATRAPLWTTKYGNAIIGLAVADAWTNGAADLVTTTAGPMGTLTVVGSRNRAPVLAPVPDVVVDEGAVVDVVVSATDADGHAVALSATGLPDGAAFKDGGDGTGRLTWATDLLDAGAYDVTFSASDGRSTPVSIVATVTVVNVNRAPELAPIGAKRVLEGATLAFRVTATDADPDDTLAYACSPLPPGASFVDATFTWTPGWDQAGVHYVTCSVTDGHDAARETVKITVVNRNRPGASTPPGR